MATTPRRRQLCALVTFLALSAAPAAAQTPAPAWYFETIAPGNLVPNCVTGGTLAGFEIDIQGRPALAWREDNGCGGPPRVFWSRFETGTWESREFFADRGDAKHHQFALRKSDGNPFMIFTGRGLFFESNAYRADLGQPNQPSVHLENVAPPQNCDNARYSLAFAPADTVPQWVTGVAFCNGQGPFRLNGSEIVAQHFSPHGSLAVGDDGTRHILWNSGTHVFYTRVPAGTTVPDHQLTLFTQLNRFGGELKIAIDNAGVLHAIVKGPDVTADWDLGAIVYLRSDDHGATWSPWEYVDPHDNPALQDPWNANSDLSLAIAHDGIPAITFWRWSSELWYAKRDGPGGTWTQQLIMALPFGNAHRANQLRYDSLGEPVIAFYDPAVNRMRLARPVPAGVTLPMDIAVTATAAPAIASPGSAATYTLTVINHSVVNVDQIVLANRLPRGVTLIDATPAPAPDGTWSLALTAGASRVFKVNVVVPATPGVIVDVASISSSVADDNPGNDGATAAVDVKPAECFAQPPPDSCAPTPATGGVDIAITGVAVPTTLPPAGISDVDVAVRNSGPDEVSDLTIELTMIGGGAVVDTAPPGAAGGDGVTLIEIDRLAPGETRWIAARVMAPLVARQFKLQARHQRPDDTVPANDTAIFTFFAVADVCFVPESDLVARWRFDGNAGDSIGTHDAQLHGETGFETGIRDRALTLGVTQSYAEVSDDAALKPQTFTIAAWIKPASTMEWDTVVAKGASGADGNMAWFDDSYWLGLAASGFPTLYTYHGGGFTQETRAPQRLAPGQWYHLAATYDGSVARVYVNGTQVAESTINQPLYYDVNAVPLTIGEDWQGGSANGAPFTGLIDEVTLHDHAFSAAEIAGFLTGSPETCVVTPNTPPTSNMADLTLMEGQPSIFKIILTDAEGDPITASFTGLPPGVTATLRAPGEAGFAFYHLAFAGSPEPGSAGTYPVVLSMSDGVNDVTRDYVITVRPPNRLPSARDDSGIATNFNHAVIAVLANDSDPDGDAIHIVGTTPPARGFLNVRNDNGTIEYYVRDDGWYTDTFTYTIEDPFGATATATVTVRVLADQHDLTVTIAPARLILSPKQTAAWTLTVTNHSWMPMRDVVAQAELPHQFTFLRSSVPSVELPALRFALGELAGGETRTVEIEAVAPDAAGVYTHGADVRGGESERHPDNHTSALLEVQPAFCFAPAVGLIGAWRFDDLAEQHFREEQGRIATHSSGEVLDFGRSGLAAAFMAGAGSRVDIDVWRGRDFTVAAWTKPDLTVPIAPVVSDVVDRSGWLGFWLGYEYGVPVLTIHRRHDPPVRVAAASAVPANTWTHLAATFDNVRVRLFVNGIEAASFELEELPEGLPLGDQRLSVGYGFAGAPTPALASYVGLLEDLLIYNRALTHDELRATVQGEPVGCVIPTFGALGLELAVVPEVAQVNGAARVEITLTNLSDGYIEAASVAVTIDSQLRFVDGDNNFNWHEKQLTRGVMKAGESHTFITEVYTPEHDGRFDFSATAQESFSGSFTSASTKVVVAPVSCFVNGDFAEPCEINDHPSLTNPGPQRSVIGAAVTLPIAAADSDGPQPLRFSADNLPPGLSIDPVTGVIAGTVQPGQASYQVSITAFDGKLAATTTFLWRTNLRLSIELGMGGALRIGELFCDAMAGPATCAIDVETPTQLEYEVTDVLPGVTGSWWTMNGQQRHAPQILELTTSMYLSIAWTVPFSVTLVNPSGPLASLLTSTLMIDVDPLSFPLRVDYLACFTQAKQCAGRLEYGRTIMVRGLNNQQRIVSGYSGSCTSEPCELTADRSGLAVTITYEPRPVTLTVEAHAGGVVRFGDVVCDGGATGQTCSTEIPHGTEVTLEPSAAAGMLWLFDDRSGLPTPLLLPRIDPVNRVYGFRSSASFTLTENRRVRVTFISPFTLALPGLLGEWGELLLLQHPDAETPFPLAWASDSHIPMIACDRSLAYAEPCLGYRPWGVPMTFAPRATLPYQFMGWSGACSGTGGCTITPGDDLVSVVGTFGRPPVVRPYGPVTIEEDEWSQVEARELFTDPNLDLVSYTVTADPGWIALTSSGGTIFRIEPARDRWGTATVTFTATDATGLSASTSFVVTVTPRNDPPTIDSIADRTVVSSALVRITPTGVSPGPFEDDQQVTLTVSTLRPSLLGDLRVSNGVIEFTSAAPATPQSATVQVVARDSLGFERFIDFRVTVLPPNTQTGSNVLVAASGPAASSPIAVSFAQVTSPGETTYEVRSGTLTPPEGFKFGNPPLWFDISTTATYTAPLRVCITYPAGMYVSPSALRLFHYEGGRWVNRTLSVDTKNRIVCASVSSLSPFALAEPIPIAGRMHGEIHLDSGGSEYDAHFRIAEQTLGLERGAIELRIQVPADGKKKSRFDRFESTAIDDLVFFETSAAFAGSGRWNGAPGYTFEARASDHGEPGRNNDRFAITIYDPLGNAVATVDETIDAGNIQSDRLKPEHWRDR